MFNRGRWFFSEDAAWLAGLQRVTRAGTLRDLLAETPHEDDPAMGVSLLDPAKQKKKS
jgi:hypothetical protein